MTTAEHADHYSPVAKLLHWVTAAAVLFIIPAGFTMVYIGPGPLQNNLFDLHRSFGVTVLALTAIRLGVRFVFGAPPAEATIAPWQRYASKTVHWLLYVMLFAMPILGWAGTSAFGARISVFWLFELPPLLAKDRALSDTLLSIHGYGGFAITGLLVLHASAALWHHFRRRDRVLVRMLPGG